MGILFNRPRSAHQLKLREMGYVRTADLLVIETSTPETEAQPRIAFKLAHARYCSQPEREYFIPIRKTDVGATALEVLLPNDFSFLSRGKNSLEELASSGFYLIGWQNQETKEREPFPVGDMKIGTTAYLRNNDILINISNKAGERAQTLMVNFRSGRVSKRSEGEYLIPIIRKGEGHHQFVIKTAAGVGFEPYNRLHHEMLGYLTVGIEAFDDVAIRTPLTESETPSPQKFFSSPEKPSKPKQTLEEILAPLDAIFLPAKVYDEVLLRTNIPDLIAGGKPKYHGVILHGPPGTGKTVLQRAIAEVYRNKGAYAKECHFSLIAEKYVGTLGHNLETAFQQALAEARERKLPSFLYFDESTSLVSKVEGRTEGAVNYYQEGLDVMKKYIGNYPGLLVVSISTNGDLAIFDEALIRAGRMEALEIDYPGKPEKVAMWKYFAKQSELGLELTEEQAQELAEAIPKEQGAFISDFCLNYLGNKRAKLLKQNVPGEGEKTILSALKAGGKVDEEALRQSLTYENLLTDVQERVQEKRAQEKQGMGFGK